ncbi:hypothetical protein AYI70_g9558 [Smittium culicis]|uniref:Uncharacterized protein n=1 Tax=Smittium culicis TaxID=133412 RepID=A0A1R1XAN7_9FUNG|nr:hypothetical protein AYI70_g9558 [Smittium culicis]
MELIQRNEELNELHFPVKIVDIMLDKLSKEGYSSFLISSHRIVLYIVPKNTRYYNFNQALMSKTFKIVIPMKSQAHYKLLRNCSNIITIENFQFYIHINNYVGSSDKLIVIEQRV